MAKKTKKITTKNPDYFTKGNRLIAEFMGFEFIDEYLFIKTPGSKPVDRGRLTYHSSWDSLMPVIEKLEKMGIRVQISAGECNISWWYSPKKTVFEWKQPRSLFDPIGGKYFSKYTVNSDLKIQAAYDNIVYFLEWFSKKRIVYPPRKKNKK